MKSLKSLHFILLASLLFIARTATTNAQTTQQSGGQSQSDADAPKDKKKSEADSATAKPQAEPASAPASTPRASRASTSGSGASKPTATQLTPAAKSASMVWVNTDSGVYHKRGMRWYGKTKKGKYMTEADAVRAGYKPAKKE